MLLRKIKNTFLPFLKFRTYSWEIEIRTGRSPFELKLNDNIENPVLTGDDVSDIAARYVADPFIINDNGTWYMFFEVLENSSGKGVISYAASEDGFSWNYGEVVLREQFHLSYPYVFNWKGNYYLIPETAEAGAVRLYKAVDFPTRWSFIQELLVGVHEDPSIFRSDGMWWMFTQTNPDRPDTLRLYFASDLLGPWSEHPKSPIVEGNPHIARPAGRVLEFNGSKYRVAQDDYPEYGLQVFAFQICELTTTSYSEKQVGDGPVLKGTQKWLLPNMRHHLDAHMVREGQWIAATDHLRQSWRPRLEF